jgi:hypothetical protein
LIVGLCSAFGRAEEPIDRRRPITDADSVLAVYREGWGLASSRGPAIILAAWPDGQIVWSKDRLNGGTPYFAGRVDPKKVAGVLSGFEKEGLFADDKLNRAHFGPDSQFITVLIKSGKKQVKMQSWHELYEISDNIVVDHRGAVVLEGRRRLDELRKAPADYLFFRTVWSETRTKLSDLIPDEGGPSTGRPMTKAGVLSWLEGTATAKPHGVGDPPKK